MTVLAHLPSSKTQRILDKQKIEVPNSTSDPNSNTYFLSKVDNYVTQHKHLLYLFQDRKCSSLVEGGKKMSAINIVHYTEASLT